MDVSSYSFLCLTNKEIIPYPNLFLASRYCAKLKDDTIGK